jgi:hypothetical protein
MSQIKRKPNFIFIIIGFLLLVTAFLLALYAPKPQSETVKFLINTFQNIAFIVLTIVIVNFLWQILGGEPIRETLKALGNTLSEMRSSVSLLEDSKRTGLHRLFSVSGALGSHREWMLRLKDSRIIVDLMGYTLHVWTRGENFEQEMVTLVERGVHVRVLIMDEGNPNLSSLVNEDQILSISVNSVIEEIKVAKKAFKAIADTLQEKNPKGSYEFRVLKQGIVVTQLCRTDSHLTSVQYLYSVVASRSPLIDVRGVDSELFQVYVNEFEWLWKLGRLEASANITTNDN